MITVKIGISIRQKQERNRKRQREKVFYFKYDALIDIHLQNYNIQLDQNNTQSYK